MDERASADGSNDRRSELNTHDVGRLARAIRRLAIEAHEVLKRPDARTGELTELRRQLKELLRAARDSRLTEIEHWLRSVERRLDARLLALLVAAPGRLPASGLAPRPRPIGVGRPHADRVI